MKSDLLHTDPNICGENVKSRWEEIQDSDPFTRDPLISFFFFCFYSPVWSRLTRRIQNTWSLGPACQCRSWGHRCWREDTEDMSGCEAHSCKEVERWWLLPISFLCQPVLSTLLGVFTLVLPGQPELCSAILVFLGASHHQCHSVSLYDDLLWECQEHFVQGGLKVRLWLCFQSCASLYVSFVWLRSLCSDAGSTAFFLMDGEARMGLLNITPHYWLRYLQQVGWGEILPF